MSGATCSDLVRYVQWVEEFASVCHPGEGRNYFADCEWVTCDCLWGSLSAPVPDNEVVACFEQGMKVERISKGAQQFTYALMQTCRARTLFLSQPCGECDQYRAERSECQDPGVADDQNATNSTNGTTLGQVSVGKKQGKSSASVGPRPLHGAALFLGSLGFILLLLRDP